MLPDKFRGTLSSSQFIEAATDSLSSIGQVTGHVVSDGGEGLIEALAGTQVRVSVRDPLMRSIDAYYAVLSNGDAVVEMSRASGLELLGGPKGNDPIAATTYGTGQLIRAAIEAGAQRVIVGCGGSATTDGGIGALEALGPRTSSQRVSIIAAVDVRTTYLDAAGAFSPQKGATPAQVAYLKRRLAGSANLLEQRYGRNPIGVVGSGAAGGLAGMIYSIGGSIVPGFDLVADYLNLEEQASKTDLMITGEGTLDVESFNGKVVGSVLALAASVGKKTLVVCGRVDKRARDLLNEYDADVIELVEEFGEDRAISETGVCVREALSNVGHV